MSGDASEAVPDNFRRGWIVVRVQSGAIRLTLEITDLKDSPVGRR